MSKTWKLVTGTALGLALAGSTGAAVLTAREQGPDGFVGAQGPGGPGGPGRRGRGGPGGALGIAGLRGLDLTEAQREQVKAVMESHKAEFEAQATKMQAARKALNDAVSSETFDEGSIRQKSADVAMAEADGAVLRAKVHSEVWALLTPEQQAKAKAMRSQMEQRRGELRQRFEQRREQRQERRRLQRG